MISVILAAGYGTRLKERTKTVAKSLLSLGEGKGKILDIIVDRIGGVSDVDRIIIAANDLFYADFETWARHYRGQVPLSITNDRSRSNDARLGAIGEIAFVAEREALAGEDLLIIGGDNVFNFDLAVLPAEMKRRAATVVGVYDMKDRSLVANKYGVLTLDQENRITAFEEKPEQPESALISTACYAMPASDVRVLVDFANADDRRDNLGEFIQHLMRQREVYGLPFDGEWLDIGSAEEYEQAQSADWIARR